jgi:molybdenum cofactor biosynthesis protein B
MHMAEQPQRPPPRVLVAAVSSSRSRALEELAKNVAEDVRGAGFGFVRNVVVKGEAQYIQQLISNVSTDNEADVIVMIGGTGFGPRDATCEAIESFVDHRIEGFGEAYRRLLREDFEQSAGSMLARATAGVYNQCLVFALSGEPVHVRRALRDLIAPTLKDAVELAIGRG